MYNAVLLLQGKLGTNDAWDSDDDKFECNKYVSIGAYLGFTKKTRKPCLVHALQVTIHASKTK